MTHKLKGILITAAAIAALALGGGAIAGATGGGHGKKADRNEKADDHSAKHGDSQKRITGGSLARASKVALAHTGGGRVTDTEVRDEEGYYEVEVTRSNGSQVDVHLDRNFNLLDASPDGAGDKPGPNGN
jgi:uncharacterized membrane protein YkoI